MGVIVPIAMIAMMIAMLRMVGFRCMFVVMFAHGIGS
jgi:hypothetical protein